MQPARANRDSGPRAKVNAGLPEPGDVLGERYSIVRTLGQGGMGAVFEATHLRLGQRLAIKVLRPDVAAANPELVARFEREARAAAKLQSIHAARIMDVDLLPGGLPYMVFEYLDGRDLDAELVETGAMPIADAVDVVMQTADAMTEAHALGIVHRDLKPSNLFVCRVNGRRVVKVLDFGISKMDSPGEAKLTATSEYFGTPYYAAPEQLHSAGSADARSDVWSLGVILFEALTGRMPYMGSPTEVIAKVFSEPVPWATEFRPAVPVELARIVMHALQKDRAQRIQSMRELRDMLAPFGPRKTVAAMLHETPPPVRNRLGDILVSDGLLTQAQLDAALAVQRGRGKVLGQVLIDMRLVSQADLMAALAKQQGIILTADKPMAQMSSWQAETVVPRVESAPPAPPRSRKAVWIALAAGLPAGILVAVGLATALRSAPATASAATMATTIPTAAVIATPTTTPSATATATAETAILAPAAEDPPVVRSPPRAKAAAAPKPPTAPKPQATAPKAKETFTPSTL